MFRTFVLLLSFYVYLLCAGWFCLNAVCLDAVNIRARRAKGVVNREGVAVQRMQQHCSHTVRKYQFAYACADAGDACSWNLIRCTMTLFRRV